MILVTLFSFDKIWKNEKRIGKIIQPIRGKFDARMEQLCKKYKNHPGFKEELAAFIRSRLVLTGQRLEKIENEINLKEQLNEVSQIVSLSYIAENYFGKQETGSTSILTEI